jgi:hypothetical protein
MKLALRHALSFASLPIIIGGLGVPNAASVPEPRVHLLTSPDGRIQVSIQMPTPGSRERPQWSARFRGRPVLTDCETGLQTSDADDLLAGVRVAHERSRSVDQRVRVLFGKSDHARDRFRETQFTLETTQGRHIVLVFR